MRILIALLLLCLFTRLNAKTLQLSTVDAGSISMTYLVPDQAANETLRVRYSLTLNQPLAYDEAATAICATTEDNTYTIKSDGTTPAFGISFICTLVDGCTKATQLNIAFYASTVTHNVSSEKYFWNESTLDLSAANIGSEVEGTETSVSTRYGLNQDQVSISNIPQQDEAVHVVCFNAFGVQKDKAPINQNSDITDWATTTEEFIVTAQEFTCETGLTCTGQEVNESTTTGESGSMLAFVPVAVLSLVSIFYTIF